MSMPKNKSAARLTRQTLQELKDKGFRFVLVRSYTLDRRVDYIQMNHFALKPVRELPRDPGEMGIFAPIDSDILVDWADGGGGIQAFIDPDV
jgi:hypothetical protein